MLDAIAVCECKNEFKWDLGKSWYDEKGVYLFCPKCRSKVYDKKYPALNDNREAISKLLEE